MNSMDHKLSIKLAQRKKAGLYRQRYLLQSPQSSRVIVDGKKYIAFCSNDYLGLANHPSVIDSFKKGLEVSGVGSGASHLIYGHSAEHSALEEELAEFTQRPRALLFSTGYMANLGVINALCGRGDNIFEDRLNHASLIDAGTTSLSKFSRYSHSNTLDLTDRMKKVSGIKIVVTDGVFSMDGDIAKIPQLAEVCQRRQGWLMVDDAHGFGVMGKNGGGLAEHFNLTIKEIPILVGTLGKAFGTFGAFVAGSEELVETLVQFSRTYIYTTALPPAIASATRTSLKISQHESWRREKLNHLIAHFRSVAESLDIKLMESATPIQPVLLYDDNLVIKVAECLKKNGFLVGAIRPPTVPKNTSRLRVTISAKHEEEDIEAFLQSLQSILKNLRVTAK